MYGERYSDSSSYRGGERYGGSSGGGGGGDRYNSSGDRYGGGGGDRYGGDRHGGGGGGDRGNRFASDGMGANLRNINWDLSKLPVFEKNFYIEHPAVRNRTETDAEHWRKSKGITVIGKGIPKVIF